LRDARTAFTRELERETQDEKVRRQAAATRVVAIVESSVAILEMIWTIMVPHPLAPAPDVNPASSLARDERQA
jgi:hypothetical protein